MLYIDVHESKSLVKQVSKAVEVEVKNLNSGFGLADFAWLSHGEWEQVENKSWTELVWGMDKCEMQLRKWMMKGGGLSLVVRGLIVPTQSGVNTYKVSYGGKVTKQKSFKMSYAKIAAWLWSLSKLGISSFEVANENALAVWLVACYRNSLKEGHSTLSRYIGSRSIWVPNPHVANLIALHDAKIGPVRAQALVRKFKTTWKVLNASKEGLCEVEGIGIATADRLWKSIGRKS